MKVCVDVGTHTDDGENKGRIKEDQLCFLTIPAPLPGPGERWFPDFDKP